MKKIVFLLIVLISLVIPTLTYAHPGNTAADGAHYCWTNCDYWGYEYGTRHYHGGGGGYSYTTSDWSLGNDAGEEHAKTKNLQYIQSNATIDAEVGYSDGFADKYEASTTYDAPVCDKEVKFTNTPTASYKSGFDVGYKFECSEIYRSKYEEVYKIRYKRGQEDLSAKIALEEKQTAESNERSSIFWWGVIGIGVAIFLIRSAFANSERYKNKI